MRTFIVALWALLLPAAAVAGLVDLQIVSRASGETLLIHRHAGQAWIAGSPGERYSVRLVNRTGQRLLAVLSVDGINAVTGETASPAQSGYVLAPYAVADISGWRKSLKEIAQFYFTALPDSYAARTDRPDHVGVIGVAVFRERARLQPAPRLEKRPSTAAPAASAEARDAASETAPQRAKRDAERIGTGHGEREDSPTEYTSFIRADDQPAQTLTLRYDTRAALIARGVIRLPPEREPDPFPARFVLDPRS